MEFVYEMANGREVDRDTMLWLTSLLQIEKEVPDEGTDAELRAKIMATRAFVGWGLRQECYPAEYCQKVREASAPADSPKCGLCKDNKASDARVEDKAPYETHTGVYLCHECKRVEIKPSRFEGGIWRTIPFDLPEAEDKFAEVLGRIMERKETGKAYT
jgi:hypothetical protein